MSDGGYVSDSELLRALLHGAPVRVAAFDRSGRLLLDPDPNPPVPSDPGVPPGGNFLDLYGHVPGLRDAIQTAFNGQVARITRLIGGATYMCTFFPRPSARAVESVIGVATIITESPVMERVLAELQAEELKLGLVIDAAPLVLWSADAAGQVTLSKGKALQALGLAPNQIVGQSLFDLYGHLPHALDALRRALAGEEFSFLAELDGIVLETLMSPMRDGDGKLTGLLGVSIDVTERHRAHAEQERLRSQLLQVQKLESLGLLAGGIAHDFNNILTTILGSASTALLTMPVENPARHDIEHVITAAQRAAMLTRQMLAYSGKEQVEVRPIDLSNHVREIATLLETTIPKKVQLRLELQPELPAIDADVAQVQQVIMNLVINGAEAIGDQRGTVLVTTGTQIVDAVYAMSLFAAEGLTPGIYVFLEVHDTGVGMDEATKSKIFDPFFTTKFTGRGLGLAAVLGIVRGHRGAIKVYSSPGRGTTFKVFFPSSGAPVARHDRNTDLGFRGEGLVLVIDDDAAVRTTTRRILEYFGFTVVEAGDGLQGVEVFNVRAHEIMLVIVDMTMPKMNGEETFSAIRRIRADVPVVLASGYNEVEATRRFTSKGLAGFLEKPFTPSDLAGKLSKILGPGA